MQMHPEDLMNSDMPSEILLLISGSLIFVTLSLILVAALTQAAALGHWPTLGCSERTEDLRVCQAE